MIVLVGRQPNFIFVLWFWSCLVINNSSSLWLDVVLCFNYFLCQVEPLGRLGWKLIWSCWKKNRNFALTRIIVIFNRRVILSWFFLKKINREIPHVHNFISEYLELRKYSKVTDYYRLFCFWQILFFVCCLLILMNLWLVSGGINHREVGIQ